jgi:hypothetical protein
MLLERPTEEDKEDPTRLTQTYLERVNVYRPFRSLASFFARIRYLHIVPQLVREPDRSIGRANDPFGGDFLEQVARTPEKTQRARLRRIQEALRVAVPQLQEIELSRDARGTPHLRGKYQHWRPQGAWQTEEQFSDGTLRLMGRLWVALDREGPLLLEEPELSLHPEIVRVLPQLLVRVQRRTGRQIFLSTHSPDLLRDEGIGLDEVLLLRPGSEGTEVSTAASHEDIRDLLEGVSVFALHASGAEVLAIEVPPQTAPVSTSDGVFLRRALGGDGRPACLPMDAASMQSLQADRGLIDPSAHIVAAARWNDLDPLEFERFRRSVRERRGRSDESLIELPDLELAKALGVVDANGDVRGVRLAALLLFGKEQALRRFVPTHEVAFQLLRGLDIEVNDFFRWPLLRVTEEIEGRIRARNREQELMVGLLRVGVPDYAERALREALANAFIHRDYHRLGARDRGRGAPDAEVRGGDTRDPASPRRGGVDRGTRPEARSHLAPFRGGVSCIGGQVCVCPPAGLRAAAAGADGAAVRGKARPHHTAGGGGAVQDCLPSSARPFSTPHR